MGANTQRGNGPDAFRSVLAYDQLPRPLRDALKASDTNWTCQSMLKHLRRARTAGEAQKRSRDLCKKIAQWDASERSAAKMRRVWGGPHPQSR